MLFKAHFKEVMQEALKSATTGIEINGILINNVRYADEKVIIPVNIEDLER